MENTAVRSTTAAAAASAKDTGRWTAKDTVSPTKDTAGLAMDTACPAKDAVGPAKDTADLTKDIAVPVEDTASPVVGVAAGDTDSVADRSPVGPRRRHHRGTERKILVGAFRVCRSTPGDT